MPILSSVSWRKLILVAGALALWPLLTGVALAAGHGPTDSNPEANLPFLLGMYTVTWAAFFAYTFYMTRRQRELRRQIEELRRSIEERKV